MIIEVAVIGRSVGESIVVRFGERRWAVIDSFCSNDEPVALRYLRRVGGDPRDIRFVVATHWDNDHVDGLPAVLRQAPRAKFVYPNVADPEKLARIAATAEYAAQDGWSRGADAFGEALGAVKEQGLASKTAASGTILWREEGVLIVALSPTDAAVEAGLVKVGRELITEPSMSTAAAAVRPNLTSIVVWIEGEGRPLVLGADLEAHHRYGWSAAIDETRELRLDARAELLKVPHHGSPDADEERTWAELLDPNPHAAVTPHGPSGRPRTSDVKRLQTHTSRLRIAAGPGWSGWADAMALLDPAAVADEARRRADVHYVQYSLVGRRWQVDTGRL